MDTLPATGSKEVKMKIPKPERHMKQDIAIENYKRSAFRRDARLVPSDLRHL